VARRTGAYACSSSQINRRLVYTLVDDDSMLAGDAARERDRAQRTAQFTTALQNMKILAEGGTSE
jgi:hypothetical protein